MTRLLLVPLFAFALLRATHAAPLEVADFAGSGRDDFRVERIAGPAEATNIYALTLDAQGRVIVSGPGYIRRLTDTDGDGSLEHSEELLSGPEAGCQGLLHWNESLYFVTRGGLHRLPLDGQGGAPELVLPLTGGGEHGPHAVRRGADGDLYLLGGNYLGFKPQQIRGFSPVVEPYAGLLLRLSPDASRVGVVAHGMRNAYDFDFLPDGEIVVWDSDGERDVGFPWYRPTRLYHLTPGADCGWRSSGSGKVPTYAMDTVAPIADAGRGSPTGLVTYRHRGGAASFPDRYRGNVFALDWTFGRVLFFALEKTAVSYRSQPEVFLEGTGGLSFAPTDVDVAPDGALIIASGGRGLDGAIYRVAPRELRESQAATSALDSVVRAAQPLSAWSRAAWAANVGSVQPAQLDAAIRSDTYTIDERIRALDVLCELFPSTDSQPIRQRLRGQKVPAEIRARAAWWAGRHGDSEAVLNRLRDPSPRVVRLALESAAQLPAVWTDGNEAAGQPHWEGDAGLAQTRRFRQAVAHALYHAPRPSRLASVLSKRYPKASLLTSAARAPRGELSGPGHFLRIRIDSAATDEERLESLRFLQVEVERFQPERDMRRVFFPRPWPNYDVLIAYRYGEDASTHLGQLISKGSPRVSLETARLAGLLGLDAVAPAITARVTPSSSPGNDVLTLSFLTRMKKPWDAPQLEAVARAVLQLPAKVEALQVGRDARWHRYVRSLWQELAEAQPKLTATALAQPEFGHPDHTAVAETFSGSDLDAAVERFASRPLPDDPTQRLQTISFLASQPKGAAREVLRTALAEPALQSVALGGLAKTPEAQDRERFHAALGEGKRLLVVSALEGLVRLPVPAPSSPAGRAEWLGALRWGLALADDPHHIKERDLAAEVLRRLSRVDTGYQPEAKTSQREPFELWRRLYRGSPDELIEALADLESSDATLARLLENPLAGSAQNGKAVFHSAGCASCHTSGGKGGRFGPDLSGLGKRFSRKDTLEAIIFPDRQVAERYRTKLFLLRDGTVLEGLTLYNSPAATLIRTRDGALHRVDADQVASSSEGESSFMPAGLLDSLTPQQIEDLVAYLRR